MTEIDPAVQAARAARIPGDPSADWDRLREQYDAILGVYLRVSVADSDDATPQAVNGCLNSFRALAADIDRFAARHGRTLEAGRTAMAGSAHAEREARTAATRATAALDAAPVQFATLVTVRRAADELSRRIGVFDAAHGLSERQAAADAVNEAARDLEARLAAAPGLADDADRTVRSLTTRIQALENRVETVPAIISSLLREFSAGCSADLVDAEAGARTAIDAGRELLAQAAPLAATSPDESLAISERAREQLTAASEILDSVHDRQVELREVKADPQAEATRVRFRLRDAQLLATNRGLVREWGSVLDAQSDRIDRAMTELESIHPDYWSYLGRLRRIDARITEVVDRMRHQIANP
ncbi:hypothetical protein [Gordonia hydrophobica]|uniref:Uncharacterized protein n=1 Tax=Gordonia hydrophobica TaxID=40516 RepID=A0ABZ2U5E6_9ACTN|nr:hypothetical protein [Gordonia hydrophobica]MBM7368789.1 hypothetical protein [Gordonia hydrophobica]